MLKKFRWYGVPKPWTGDSEASVTEPDVRPRYDTMTVSTSADRSLRRLMTGVGNQLTIIGQIWRREPRREHG